jgi:alkylation response protein AidB-like acyl-CoA dehydrogenase
MKLQGRVMAMWFNDLRILSAKVNHDDARLARMVVKLENTEMRHEMEALAVDAMGELGLAYEDNPYLRNHGTWQHHYMFTLGLIIGGGTSQIQKNIIGENGLGFPREMPYKKPAKRA